MTGMILVAATVILIYVSAVFLLALLKRDNGVMDVAWGPGFVLLSCFTLMLSGEPDARQILLSTLVTIWGARLCIHILIRNAGRGEDFRYRNWRNTWGRWFYLRSYLQIFMLQGFFMFIVSMPILLVNAGRGGPLGVSDWIGLAVWMTGFLFEAVGDFQLLRFMRNGSNKGRIMRYGLWKYTRHPNYFGEATLWWGCFLIALNVSGGCWALISPLVINWLLLYVSGIPMLEEKYKNNPEYQDYKNETSAFFPWFPKKP